MNFIEDFFAYLLENGLQRLRLKNKTVYIIIVVCIICAFMAFALFLFFHAYYIRGTILLLFSLLLVVLFIYSLRKNSKK